MKQLLRFSLFLGCYASALAQPMPLQTRTSSASLPDLPIPGRVQASLTRTANCVPDTVYYPFAKANSTVELTLSSVISANGIAQWYDAPASIQLHGFALYGYSTSLDSVLLTCEVYQAGPDSLPAGAPIATHLIWMKDDPPVGPVTSVEHLAIFANPITISGPYLIAVRNPNPNGVVIFLSNFTQGEGQQEWLAMFRQGTTWFHGYQVSANGQNLDADAYLQPLVSYDLSASFISLNACAQSPDSNAFQANTDTLFGSRFYNPFAYLNMPEQSWLWDFDDGSIGVGQNIKHVFQRRGDLLVTHVQRMGWTNGCRDTAQQLIGGQPDGDIAWTAAGPQINFTTNSTNVNSWEWNFGDGGGSTVANPSHTYPALGTYPVSVKITSQCDTLFLQRDIQICDLLDAGYDYDLVDSLAYTVQFSDQSLGATGWFWDFGDGNFSIDQNPSHTYAGPGDYKVIGFVTNTCGEEDSVQQNLSLWRTSLEDDLAKTEFRLFPNPGSDALHLRWNPQLGPGRYTLYTAFGQVVKSGTLSPLKAHDEVLVISDGAPGLYWLEARWGNIQVWRAWLKQ